jgi:hypothetical protein
MQEETCGVVEFLYKCNCENVEHWCSQTRKLTENLAQGNLCWIVATYKAGTETTAPIERLGQKMQANRKRREVLVTIVSARIRTPSLGGWTQRASCCVM